MKQDNYKPLHKSWKKFAIDKITLLHPIRLDLDQYYIQGVKDFRIQALDALEIFSALTKKEPVIYNKEVYVSLEDVRKLIEGLYAETIVKKIKPKKKKNGKGKNI